MGVLLLGLNHRTAPVEVRERLAFSRDGVATALMLFRQQFPHAEATIISTCNRVEMLISTDSPDLDVPHFVKFLSQVRDVPAALFQEHLYCFRDTEAVRQTFRVISGLDSMVIGEYQIVNQLKQAYEMAHEQRTAGPVLHRLFHHAFGVSKRTRTETTIGEGKTSISSVAVDIIKQELPDFADRQILIVGAGEMAQLAAEYLRDSGARKFSVTTRTLTNAKALAEVCCGSALPFNRLDDHLVDADIVITATSCPTAILTASRIYECQSRRANRPLLLIDLAVPRNIAADVTNVEGVRLHDVDSLGRIVNEHARQRESQLAACDRIIDEEVTAFNKWIAESRLRPLIEQMYADVRALTDIEVRATLRRCPDFTETQRQAIEQLAERLVNKLMHPCVSAVREQASSIKVAEGLHKTRLSAAPKGESKCPHADAAEWSSPRTADTFAMAMR